MSLESSCYLLVYEFMPNRNLDTHIYDSGNMLAWSLRFEITIGVAFSLLYLREWEQCVVHCDVKPSNVILDSGFNAKIGDFGPHGLSTMTETHKLQ
ncbi:hypothetical protein GUJ93_ZPchr0007g3558 [Zizania palustris]|uniref:Protein kinase domain-containing protein n=1 Tax=Zizania palustris TaxID=103762 RepID=A0A8J5SQ92_ZIZPA|nr:hypothetical protein GUJ93_ZPchr0007g3558 [Zizania palustris]